MPRIDQYGRRHPGYTMQPMKFDEKTLQDIASTTNGKYFPATDTASLKKTFNEIDQMEKTKVEVQKTADYRDLFPWFLLAGFVLLGAEVLLSQTIWKRLP
jgi:Ca-activated chloride channel family protein